MRFKPTTRSIPMILAGSLVLGLAGCGTSGFTPLYATGSGVSERLAQVSVAPIPGRVGQQIRNELLYQTTGGDRPAEPAYRLEVAVRESFQSTLVGEDANAAGRTYTLDASFRLIDIKSQEVILTGTSYGRAPYERFNSVFTNVRAQRDAENRAAKTVGNELKTRLEAFLATRPA
ncbi:MAG: LPS assembly lipoprotein LptE [Pseudomonadota bacterium]